MLSTIASFPSWVLFLIVGFLLYNFWHVLKKAIPVILIMGCLYYYFNNKLPWTPKQGKQALAAVGTVFKERDATKSDTPNVKKKKHRKRHTQE